MQKRAPKSLKKHYLQKLSSLCFRDVEKAYKTNGKPTFPQVSFCLQKTLQNKWYSEGISPKMQKRAPKSLKKHWLQKLFSLRFRDVEKAYKTNGKLTFPQVSFCFHKTLQNQWYSEGIPSKMIKGAPK